MRQHRLQALLSCFAAMLVVSGCGTGSPSVQTYAAVSITGRIMGGQQPVSGASLQLYAVTAGGYGSASTPLLSPAVSTDANGSFTLPAYTCPGSKTQMYLVASGGNPGMTGTVNNTALKLMAVLGSCGQLSSATHVTVNEITTVAAVWALAPFMTGADHVGTSAGNVSGLSNAFALAAVLVNPDTGQTPGIVSPGTTLPTAEINALGDVLASCANTSGGTSGDGSACGSLFANTTVSGNSAPTDTIGAALNIALHPGTKVSAIYGLVNATGPFQPSLTSAPNDWTVAAAYPLSGSYPMTGENGMAVDANGNLWIQDGTLQELSTTGVILGSYSGMAGTSVALDSVGNVWASAQSLSGDTITKMSTSGGAITTYSAAGLTSNVSPGTGLAIDSSSNIWYTCTYCQAVGKLNSDGSFVATYPLTINRETNIAIDPNANLWFGNSTRGAVNVLMSAGSTYSTSPFNCGTCSNPQYVAIDSVGNAWITGSNAVKYSPSGATTSVPNFTGGLNSGQAVAVDGASNAWVVNSLNISNAYSGALTQLTSAGTAVSPSLGYVSSTLSAPYALAIDGSGNIWLANTGSKTVTVFIGAATPVVAPFAKGLSSGTLATRP